MNLVTICVAEGHHVALKQSREAFAAGTERMPHYQHEDCVQDDIWIANCRRCQSTLGFELNATTRVNGRALRADACSEDDEPALSPLVPESWSACMECRTLCAGDFCDVECRAEWTTRWVASGHACDEQAMAVAS